MFGNTSCRKIVVGPFSADSANSHQGCFSRVQNAKGMSTRRGIRISHYRLLLSEIEDCEIVNLLHASCMQTMFTPPW